ncbi:MAG TPA: TolC family protein [Dissulfurispiraceae bacterium]|nr:TolC family protein [Dissulfurispiraceae bacterium]
MINVRYLAIASVICFFISFLIVIAYSFAAAEPPREYTLDDAYRLALAQAERIRIVEQDVAIADRGRDKALSALLPRLTAFYGYTRFSDQQTGGGFVIQPDSAQNWGGRADYSLSLGGKEFFALKSASLAADRSKFTYDAFREAYLLGTAAAYYDVLQAKRQTEIARASIERLTKYRDAAKTRLRIGEVTKTAVLRAEAELSGAQSDLIRLDNLEKYAKAFLARTISIEGDFTVQDAADIDEESAGRIVLGCAPLTLQCAAERAYVERAEVKAAELLIGSAQSQVSAARAAFFPSLGLSGVYSRSNQSPSSILAVKESIYGALTLTFPLFEGGLRVAEAREASSKLRQAELTFSDTKRDIALDVEQSYLQLMTARGVLHSLADQVSFARDNYTAVSRQFDYGLATSLDVLDANNLLVSAERQYATAKYAYHISLLRMQRSAGLFLKSIPASASGKVE